MIYYSCIPTSWEAPLSWPVPVQLSYMALRLLYPELFCIIYDICILFNNKIFVYNTTKIGSSLDARRRGDSVGIKMSKWQIVRLRQLYLMWTPLSAHNNHRCWRLVADMYSTRSDKYLPILAAIQFWKSGRKRNGKQLSARFARCFNTDRHTDRLQCIMSPMRRIIHIVDF